MTKADMAKLLKKLLGLSVSAHVLDVLFHVFGDASGHLDVHAFLEVMQRREVMWGRRVSRVWGAGGWGAGVLAAGAMQLVQYH